MINNGQLVMQLTHQSNNSDTETVSSIASVVDYRLCGKYEKLMCAPCPALPSSLFLDYLPLLSLSPGHTRLTLVDIPVNTSRTIEVCSLAFYHKVYDSWQGRVAGKITRE